MIDPFFVALFVGFPLLVELRNSWRAHCEFMEDFNARADYRAERRQIERDRWF